MSDFQLREDGVFRRSLDHGEEPWCKVCSRLEVVAQTRDCDSDQWGRLLKWDDADGKPHEFTMHQSSLATGNGKVLAELLSGGLVIEPNMRDSVIEYIQSQQTERRVLTVSNTGWHGDFFVLPDIVIKDDFTEYEIRYATRAGLGDHGYGVAGSVEDWRREAGAFCRRNSRLLYGTSSALAAPTLDMLEEESSGDHIYGRTSCGKTTVLVVATSVWGGGKAVKSWRSTSNALENIAAAHNDCFLPLDEFGQLDPKDADRVAYGLGCGQSKARMNADSSSQRQKRWRLQFLSTGEVTAEQQANSVGSRTRGGGEVRMVNIPADAGKGLGAFEDLHGIADGAQFAIRLKEAALKYYGAVGREWLKLLTYDRSECTKRLKEYIREFERDYTPKDAAPEVGRVVHRFAIIAAGGELATEFDLTGWEAGDATWGAATCLEAWLDNRGGAKKGHDGEQMFRQVRHFIQSHEYAFIEIVDCSLEGSNRVFKPVGYLRRTEDGIIYYVQTEIFKIEACKGHDYKQVRAALKQAGHLVYDSPRWHKQIEIRQSAARPKHRQRFYAIKDSLFTDDETNGE